MDMVSEQKFREKSKFYTDTFPGETCYECTKTQKKMIWEKVKKDVFKHYVKNLQVVSSRGPSWQAVVPRKAALSA